MTRHLDVDATLAERNPLDQAERHLRQLAEGASDGDRAALLNELAWLVDHVRRIAQSPSNYGHYRAEKAGVLLSSALRVHRLSLEDYAAPRAGTLPGTELRRTAEVLETVAGAARQVMWRAGRPVSPRVAREVSNAGHSVAAWAHEVAGRVGPAQEVDAW
jgi:hypothetical protein